METTSPTSPTPPPSKQAANNGGGALFFFSERSSTSKSYWTLLLINYFSMFIGSVSSSLLTRFYFSHGGSSRWATTFVQSAGFPLLVPLLFLFLRRTPFASFTRRLSAGCLAIGLLMGVNNFLISWGMSYLPVSTSSLLLSCQLAFNLALSVLLVRQRLHFSNLNCVILITLASVLLAIGSSRDMPPGVSSSQFFLGFASILGAAFLFALYLPLMEIVLRDVADMATVVEVQAAMQLAATVFASAGMAFDGGFSEMAAESQRFGLGEAKYWVVIGATIITWQMCFMGTAGVVYLTTSLTTGICMTALLPMNELGGVLAFGDAFGGLKAVATALCLWGFGSYLYGEYVRKKSSLSVEISSKGEEKMENTSVVDNGGDHAV